MKIQKKYQGAIPLNRIANEYNESEINTYSTGYLNNTFVPRVEVGDYVVERGDNYRKWNSGRAEVWGSCYGYGDVGSVQEGTALYRASEPLDIDYSGVFIEDPMVFTTIRYVGSGRFCFVLTSGYDITESKCSNKYLASTGGLGGNLEYSVEWYAMGRWR